MTGVYSVSMNLCGAIASGISVPIASSAGLGWKGALGRWAILSFIAFVMWIPQMRGRELPVRTTGTNGEKKSSLLAVSACLEGDDVHGAAIPYFLHRHRLVAGNSSAEWTQLK